MLVPVDTAGRVVELGLLFDEAWTQEKISHYPIAILNYLAFNTLDFARSMIEWMSDTVSNRFDLNRENPFQFKNVHLCHSRQELDALPSPKVVLASSASMESGFSQELFLGSHEAVLDALEQGDADVGGTFCPVDDAGVPDDPPWARRRESVEPGMSDASPLLAALAVSERVPPDAVAAGPDAPKDLVAQLAAALQGADGTKPTIAPLFARVGASGFVAPDLDRYGVEASA